MYDCQLTMGWHITVYYLTFKPLLETREWRIKIDMQIDREVFVLFCFV